MYYTIAEITKRKCLVPPGDVEHSGEGEDGDWGRARHVHPAELDPVSDGRVHVQRPDDEVPGQGYGHGGEDGDREAGLQAG